MRFRTYVGLLILLFILSPASGMEFGPNWVNLTPDSLSSVVQGEGRVFYNSSSGVIEFWGSDGRYGVSATDGCSYVVYKRNYGSYNRTIARNCTTGLAEYSSLDDADTINYALNGPGRKVVVRRGIYEIGSYVKIRYNDTVLVGEGRGTVFWLKDWVNTSVIALDTSLSQPVYGIVLANFKVYGNRDNQQWGAWAGGYPNLVHLANNNHPGVREAVIENLWLEEGVHGGLAVELEDGRISNIWVNHTADNGVYISGNNRTVITNVISMNNRNGIAIKNGGKFVSVSNVITMNNSAAGVYVLSNNFVTLSNIISYRDTYGITVSYSNRVNLGNIILRDTVKDGISIKASDVVKVSDSTLSNVGAGAATTYVEIKVVGGSRFVKIADNLLESNVLHKILLSNANDTTVVSNTFSAGGYAVYMNESTTRVTISDNEVRGTVTHGFVADSTTSYISVRDNDIYSSATKISLGGSNSVISENRNYVTRNYGNVTLPATVTTVNVTHGLVSTPTVFVALPRGDVGYCYSTYRDSTNVTITCSTAPTVDVLIDWYAEYKP